MVDWISFLCLGFINMYDLDWFKCRYNIHLPVKNFTSSYSLATSLYVFFFPHYFFFFK